MTDETNAVVTAAEPVALKSSDTRTTVTVTDKPRKAEPAPEKAPETAKEVEPATKAEDVPPEGERDAPDADSHERKQQRLPRWMKERLERERQVTEARTREAVLKELQERQTQAPPEKAAPKEKTLEDFDFDQDKYLEYKVQSALEKHDQAAKREAEQKRQAEAQEAFKSRVDAFEERAGDGAWEDLVSSKLNTDPSYKGLTDLFMGDDHDLDIAHYLVQHPKEAERIVGLTKLQQVREVAKLAERFDGSPKDVDTPSEAPKAKKTTSAPPPPKTISGSGKSSVDINDPNMSTEQRIAAWRAKRA